MRQDTARAVFSTHYNAPISGGVKSAVSKMLRSLDLVGWSTREESGRVDRRAFTRFATGSTNVFSRRTYKEADVSAVHVLVDCSGSMYPDAEMVQATIVQLARVLEECKTPFAMTGFYGSYDTVRTSSTIGTTNDTTRGEALTLVPFKGWNESVHKASAKLGSYSHTINDSTPDYSGLKHVITDISTRPERRKIVFVITDADDFSVRGVKHLHTLADKLGVTIAALGIGSNLVGDVFRNSVVVKNGLESASFRLLANNLK